MRAQARIKREQTGSHRDHARRFNRVRSRIALIFSSHRRATLHRHQSAANTSAHRQGSRDLCAQRLYGVHLQDRRAKLEHLSRDYIRLLGVTRQGRVISCALDYSADDSHYSIF